MNWDLFLNALVAIGTIGAVLVALFGQAFRAKFFPPELKLTLDDSRGHKTPVSLVPPQDSGQLPRLEEAFYFRLRVSNGRRWSPATQVRADLLRLENQQDDGSFAPLWTGDIPLVWKHQPIFPPARTVGQDAIADLCSVVRGKWLEIHANHCTQSSYEDARCDYNPRYASGSGCRVRIKRPGHQDQLGR